MFKKAFSFSKALYILIVVLIAISCAKIGTIEGGPKDVDPPVFISSKPANYATNFKGHKIEIDFDEYLQLSDLNTQLNVSPPLKKKPKALLYNKTIKVEFSDTLKDSTTYTFNFGKSIGDFNENNILQNFEFVVSTTNYLDSMAVKGTLCNASDLKPFKDPVLVMLYSNLNDTAPYRIGPTFTCRSNAKGEFFLNNVKEGKYRMYALKDANSNYKYDPPAEEFAFIDTVIELTSSLAKKLSIADSIKTKEYTDSVALKKLAAEKSKKKLASDKPASVADKSKKSKESLDSLRTDTIVEIRNASHALPINLFLFKEYDYKQYIKNYVRTDKRRIDVMFNRPLLNDTLEVVPTFVKAKNWYLLESNRTRDTFSYWLTDTALINNDTLRLTLHYTATDKAGRYLVSQYDSLLFRYSEKKVALPKKKRKSDDTTEVKPKPVRMKLGCSQSVGSINLGNNILFTSEYPLAHIAPDSIKLFQNIDSLDRPVNFTFANDTLPRRHLLKYKWKEKEKYHLVVLPGAFVDIYGFGHDTIDVKFNGQALDQYGRIVLNIANVKSPMLIQLLEGEKVVRQQKTSVNGKVVFEYLNPSTYTVKYVFDDNRNGLWDTGCFPEHIQPEKIGFFKDALKVRANWDLEQAITITDRKN